MHRISYELPSNSDKKIRLNSQSSNYRKKSWANTGAVQNLKKFDMKTAIVTSTKVIFYKKEFERQSNINAMAYTSKIQFSKDINNNFVKTKLGNIKPLESIQDIVHTTAKPISPNPKEYIIKKIKDKYNEKDDSETKDTNSKSNKFIRKSTPLENEASLRNKLKLAMKKAEDIFLEEEKQAKFIKENQEEEEEFEELFKTLNKFF